MKRKALIGMLVLAMSLSVTACGSSSSDSAADSATSANAETSKDAEKSVSQESSEAEVESESETDADQADMRNDLPVGYIADGGYYNSYFGFKFEASAASEVDETSVSQIGVVGSTFSQNHGDISDIDFDLENNYETVENALTSLLDSNGSASVYYTYGAFTDGNQTFVIWVDVIKGTTLDNQIAEDKESIQENSYLSEATQGTVTIVGDTKECLTFVEYPYGSADTSVETPVAYIYYDKDDYVCRIQIRNYSSYSSLEDVCATFDAF